MLIHHNFLKLANNSTYKINQTQHLYKKLNNHKIIKYRIVKIYFLKKINILYRSMGEVYTKNKYHLKKMKYFIYLIRNYEFM